MESTTPASVLSVNGGTDIYLRPFFEEEYNDLAYQKTISNSSVGNPNVAIWVHVQQVPRAHIELRRAGGARTLVSEEPFYVEQAEAASVGYRIMPYTGLGSQQGKDPSLIAFRIPVASSAPAGSTISIRLIGPDGAPLPGSDRQVRVLRRTSGSLPLAMLAFVPLLAMAIVIVRRARSYTR